MSAILSPDRAEGHGCEYPRNRTLCLFAALNTAPSEMLGMAWHGMAGLLR